MALAMAGNLPGSGLSEGMMAPSRLLVAEKTLPSSHRFLEWIETQGVISGAKIHYRVDRQQLTTEDLNSVVRLIRERGSIRELHLVGELHIVKDFTDILGELSRLATPIETLCLEGNMGWTRGIATLTTTKWLAALSEQNWLFPQLLRLNLRGNNLTHEDIIPLLSRLPKLEELYLGNNPLWTPGSTPKSIPTFPTSLRGLELQNTGLSSLEQIWTLLAALKPTALTHLNLLENPLPPYQLIEGRAPSAIVAEVINRMERLDAMPPRNHPLSETELRWRAADRRDAASKRENRIATLEAYARQRSGWAARFEVEVGTEGVRTPGANVNTWTARSSDDASRLAHTPREQRLIAAEKAREQERREVTRDHGRY